jgi:hypothetical protein
VWAVSHGVRQGASFDISQSEVVPFLSMGAKAGLNTAQTDMTDNLRIEQGDQLLPAREILCLVVALVLLFEFLEFVSRKNLWQLTQHRCNLFHGLELLVNRADINRLVTFNIAVSQVFSRLSLFFYRTLLINYHNA